MGSRKESAPPRVRLAKHIDLTKAKPGCKRCNGRGIRGYKTADLGDGEGEQQIPIICRCVSRAGGVEPDELDRILAEAKESLDAGVFHEHLVEDIYRMPEEAQPRAVAGLMRGVVDKEKPKESREAISLALNLLGQGENWSALRGQAIRILMRDASDPLCGEEQRELATRAMAAARASMN